MRWSSVGVLRPVPKLKADLTGDSCKLKGENKRLTQTAFYEVQAESMSFRSPDTMAITLNPCEAQTHVCGHWIVSVPINWLRNLLLCPPRRPLIFVLQARADELSPAEWQRNFRHGSYLLLVTLLSG